VKPRKKHLTTARKCRRFLNTIANELYTGQIEPVVAGKIAYVVSIILRSIEVDEIESRIKTLEDLTNGKIKTFHHRAN
jgi:hypothetical protein